MKSSDLSKGMSAEQGALFGQIIDRLLTGEVLGVERLREEYPNISDEVLEQLHNYQDMMASDGNEPALSTLGDYSIVRQVGRGGMGIVYEAWQNSINRRVALKVLPAGVAADTKMLARFIREAQVVGKLKHPNVVSVFGMGVEAQTPYYAMEFVDGQSLADFLRLIDDPAASNAEFCSRMARSFVGVAKGLQHAHEEGVVHRDIKPSNLMFETNDQDASDRKLRILDFGLARHEGQDNLTMTGDILGTVAYMSPEQAAASNEIDRRTDVYSLGATMYESLTLQPPLKGKNTQETLSQIESTEPVSPRSINPHIPRDLETIVLHCLRKDPRDRYSDAKSVAIDLQKYLRGEAIVARPQSTIEKIARRTWRLRRTLTVGAIVATVVLSLAVFSRSQNRAKQDLEWVQDAMPRIQECIDQERYIEAFQLVKRVRHLAPENETVESLASLFLREISVSSDPPGAKVSIQEYGKSNGSWLELGTTPLEKVEAPVSRFRWRVELQSCAPQEFVRLVHHRKIPTSLEFPLSPKQGPIGMLLVGGGNFRAVGIGRHAQVSLPRFWMDRQEVANEAYQEFVDQGGYSRPDYWNQTFEQSNSEGTDGQNLSFEEAMARFVDETGKAGPSGWHNGRHPKGEGKLPVSGVSWYEAMAYARFRGKSLPSVFHWRGESGFETSAPTTLSNIATEALAPVGESPALSPNGLRDMIGNVKEWCSNSTADSDERFALGGCWQDPAYAFHHVPTFSPWERSEAIGFRCVKYVDEMANSVFLGPVDKSYPIDHTKRRPLPVEKVQDYITQIYDYSPFDLEPELERIRETPQVTIEKITINSAYGERFDCLLYLPAGFKRPLQAMVTGCANGEWYLKDVTENREEASYVLSSGRAVIVPAKYGHFGRHPGNSSVDGKLASPQQTQRRRVCQMQDYMCVMDYLQTRADIDQSKIGHIGFSSGASKLPMVLAIENRFRTGIMVSGGLASYEVLESCEPFNFAPLVNVPVLMLNRESDTVYPVGNAQEPLFRLLGTPAEHKRHMIFPGGHGFFSNATRKQTLELEQIIVDWLDKYLGEPIRE